MKLAVAQLKIKKLEEEQRLKTMEHDLEKLRLQLEMERQLLNARVEVEQAQIELSIGSGDSGDIGNRPSILPSYPSRRYTRRLTDILLHMRMIGQDQLQPRFTSLRKFLPFATFLADPKN